MNATRPAVIGNRAALLSHGPVALRAAVLDVVEAGLAACDPGEDPVPHPVERRESLYAEITARLAALPGVSAAAEAFIVPVSGSGWNEQIVKRGWTNWKIPGVLQPGLTWMWGLVIVAGAAIFFTAFQQRRDHAATHRVDAET